MHAANQQKQGEESASIGRSGVSTVCCLWCHRHAEGLMHVFPARLFLTHSLTLRTCVHASMRPSKTPKECGWKDSENVKKKNNCPCAKEKGDNMCSCAIDLELSFVPFSLTVPLLRVFHHWVLIPFLPFSLIVTFFIMPQVQWFTVIDLSFIAKSSEDKEKKEKSWLTTSWNSLMHPIT